MGIHLLLSMINLRDVNIMYAQSSIIYVKFALCKICEWPPPIFSNKFVLYNQYVSPPSIISDKSDLFKSVWSQLLLSIINLRYINLSMSPPHIIYNKFILYKLNCASPPSIIYYKLRYVNLSPHFLPSMMNLFYVNLSMCPSVYYPL